MSDRPDLLQLRSRLEALDRELLELVERRLALVVPIAEAKLDAATPFRDQAREGVVYQRVRDMAGELGLDPNRADALFRLIIEWSVAQQQVHLRERATVPLRVSYQGVEGSYTHLAAQKRYAGRAAGAFLEGHPTFRSAVEAVRSGAAHVALLPIENTTAGSITQTYDLLAEGGVTITGEVVSHISHCLMALPGTPIERLREIRSHPQALRQCEQFFQDHPWLQPVEAFDTAGAARGVRDLGRVENGAIASEAAAVRYGLQVIAHRIQTQSGNYTRFVEVAVEAATVDDDSACTTSMLMELVHEPGALGRVLAAFADKGVDLTKLESRPIVGQPWRYRFYVDVAGHVASGSVADAIEAAGPHCAELRVLGSYPSAERPAPPEAG